MMSGLNASSLSARSWIAARAASDNDMFRTVTCSGCFMVSFPDACSDVPTRQATLTSMLFGRAFSDLGRWTMRTPSLKSAFTFAASASSGSVKLRAKLP